MRDLPDAPHQQLLRNRDRDVLRRSSPPHFHARYSGESAKIEIATGAVLAGSLSGRALRLVREWVEQHRDELEANWERAVNNDKPAPIEPLK
jgi:hypothetical protein